MAALVLLAAVTAARAADNPQDCAATLDAVSTLPASKLLRGAAACAEAGRQEDTNYLLILGQVRGMADLTILAAANSGAKDQAAQLYATLWSQGGLGFDEFYREASHVDRLETRVRAADLAFTPDYDPGWAYGAGSKTELYDTVLGNLRERRIWQMRNWALRMQDDTYYALNAELAALLRAHPTLQVGTPAYEEHLLLQAALRQAEAAIPQLPPPADTTPYAQLNAQDAEIAERQLASGFNGPATPRTDILGSAAEVRESWLARALEPSGLEAMLARVDFATQTLVAVAVGERMNTAQILLSRLEHDGGYVVVTRVGVVPESCGIALAESYPFVVGVVTAPSAARIRSQSVSNFPADCGPVASGEAVAE